MLGQLFILSVVAVIESQSVYDRHAGINPAGRDALEPNAPVIKAQD